jgi:hypothetical protein
MTGRSFSARCALASALALIAGGCGDSAGPGDEEPLRLGDVFPTDGGTGVPIGAAVTISFLDQADPASLDGALTIRAGLDLLPVTVSYDESRRVATVSAPLLPATSYIVRLDTTARAEGGGGLEAAREWTFSTAGWQASPAADVETFGLTSWGGPAMARTANGLRHLVYASFGSVHYASCASACGQPGAWTPVDALIHGGLEPSLAPDGTGGLHLLTGGHSAFALHYSRCASGCTIPENWTTVWLEQAGDVGRSSLQVGPDGALHAAGYRASSGDLLYGHCTADCTTAASWTFLAVAESGDVGQQPSLALDAEGRVHIAYLDFTSRDLVYAVCSASCGARDNWTTRAVNPDVGAERDPSLAVGPDGSIGIAYYDEIARSLRFALCGGDCAGSGAWVVTTIEQGPDVGREPSLAIDERGRAHLAHYDFGNGALRYATCARDCGSGAFWRGVEADGDGDVGRSPALVVGGGRVSIAYTDYTNGNPLGLKVVE